MPTSLSARTFIVNKQHRAASDANPGTFDEPFSTVSRAAGLAGPGDTVRVYAGVYRERVAPERGGESGRPVIYEAAPGERVIIRGSEIWNPHWDLVPGSANVFTGPLDPAFWEGSNPYKTALSSAFGSKTLGQVFVDGAMLPEVDRREDVMAMPGTWMAIEEGGALMVHFASPAKEPHQCEVEIAVRSRIFAPVTRGLGHIIVRGFTMEHCANNFPRGFWSSDTPQAGALGCRGGHYWVIENNVVRFAKTLGIDCGSEGEFDLDGLNQPQPSDTSGHHIIRNNVISDNGAAGIAGIRARSTQVTGNILERNNALGFTAPETGAMKFHFFTDGLIEGNLIRDNDCYGIWLDNVWHGTRVTRNLLVANQAAGIFIELGTGPLLVDNNIVAFTRATTYGAGDGIYSHDASGVTLVHNLLFFNSNFGVWWHIGTDRTVTPPAGNKSPASASGWRVLNNIIVGNHRGAVSMPAPHERANDNRSDCNLLAGGFDLLTQESHAEEMNAPLLVMNTNKGRVPPEEVRERFENALAEAPAAQPSDFVRWSELPLLLLREWQLLTGQDRQSMVPKVLRPMFSTRSLHVEFIIDESPLQIGAPAIEGVDRDYFGAPISDNPLPGPFQTMRFEPRLAEPTEAAVEFRGRHGAIKNENLNRFLLWPQRIAGYSGVKIGGGAEEDFQRDF